MFTIVNKILITFVKIIGVIDLLHTLQTLYPAVREKHLQGRYITLKHIEAGSCSTRTLFSKRSIGVSVQKRPLLLFTAGSGPVKVLMWSQMHGNETTTTKALADLFNFLDTGHEAARTIVKHCTLYIIPMLNPDGALAYTRENANGADLNRDARALLQPESRALRNLCEAVQPRFCFNLHDQRSLYGVGHTSNPAVLSFLSPLQDKEATVSPARKKAMQLIVGINHLLQKVMPGHIGRYDDAFNPDCTGDTFQAKGIPTVLFEAGHFKTDYQREEIRKWVFYALVQSLCILSSKTLFDSYAYTNYFDIPENRSSFFDILITGLGKNKKMAAGIRYKEVLKRDIVNFFPVIEKKGDLDNYYGHITLNYNKKEDRNYILKDKFLRKLWLPDTDFDPQS